MHHLSKNNDDEVLTMTTDYEKKLVSVGTLKKGDTIILDGAPCRVTDTATSRPGKHGHAKVNLTAVGMLDGKKRQTVMPGHDRVEAPIVEKKNAQVLSISGNTANVMDTETYETFDMDIPEELRAEVKDGVEILYWVLMGAKVMKQVK
ncbi:translation initiation factor IF-5A [Candidatus Woesearchaeota archaeon]|nr:translation initiation factor IF-5A [Candidatus Woesearchaeota archaeon]